MAETTTKRVVEIDVKMSADALAALKARQQSMKEMENSFKSAKDAVKSFAVGFAAAFSVGAVVSGIKSTIDAMDQLNDRAGQLGTSVQTLTEWGYAAKMSGASSEELDAGIRGLSKSMADMGNATAASTKALESFGVTATDDVDTALTKIAEAFSKMPDGPQKTALAMDLLGKSGAKLIPLLNEGADGVKKFKEEAAKAGVVLTDSTVAAAALFNDQLDAIGEKTRGLGVQFVNGLLPALNTLVEVFSDAIGGADGFRAAGEILGGTIINVVKAFMGLKTAVVVVGQTLGGTLAALDLFSRREFKASLEVIKITAEEVKTTIADAAREMEELDKRFLDNQTKRDTFKPKSSGGQTTRTNFTAAKPEIDKDVQALERYIKATRDATLAVDELSAAQELEIQVQNGSIKVTTEKEKLLLAQARAAANTLDLVKRQRAEEAADKKAAEESLELLKKQKEEIDAAREKFLDMQDPLREINRQFVELDKVVAATFDDDILKKLEKARLMLRQNFTESLMFGNKKANELTEGLTKLGETLKQEVEGYSKDAAAALVEFASTGKSSVKDMVQSILSDLAKLAVKQALDPVFKDFGGFIQKMLTGAQGLVFAPGGVTAFAQGGVVGGPTFFGMSGGGVGLMGEAGPEAVVPLKRTAGGDLGVQASPVNVTVVNNTGAQIKTEESQGGMGQREILIMVNQAVEDGIGRGRFDRVMSTSYGVTRRGR